MVSKQTEEKNYSWDWNAPNIYMCVIVCKGDHMKSGWEAKSL